MGQNKGVTASSGGHSAGASPPSPSVSALRAAAVNARPIRLERDEIAHIIRRELVDDIHNAANPHWAHRTPDVLFEGCKAVGYVDPEGAAQQFALLIADAILTAQGIETEGRDREAGLGAKHESPVGEADAPKSLSRTYRDGVEDAAKVAEHFNKQDWDTYDPGTIAAAIRSLASLPPSPMPTND